MPQTKTFNLKECARRNVKMTFTVWKSELVLMDCPTWALNVQCDHPNTEDGVISHSKAIGFFFDEDDAKRLAVLKADEVRNSEVRFL
jgi:hypothetical protein